MNIIVTNNEYHMKKKIIIFGGTGGVGAYTSIRLIEQGYEVIVVGHRQHDNNFFESKGATYISVDISSKNDFDKLPQDGVFAIIDMAGMMPARMKGYDPQIYIDINISGTLNVLLYAEKIKVEKFVFAQSKADISYLMGSKDPIPADVVSKFPLNTDHSVYSISKNAAVSLVEHYATKCGFSYYVLRICNITIYHPNHYFYVNGHLRRQGLMNIIDQIKAGEDVELWGDPNRLRDMFYVKDMAQIINCCLTTKAKGGIYNVGTGKGTTRKEQIQVLIDVFAENETKKPNIIVRTDKPDSPQYIMDISKTINELGYHPEYDCLKMFQDYKREMENNPFEDLWGKPEDYEIS